MKWIVIGTIGFATLSIAIVGRMVAFGQGRRPRARTIFNDRHSPDFRSDMKKRLRASEPL
jgi:hypothetical protein